MDSGLNEYHNLASKESARITSRRLWIILLFVVTAWSVLIIAPAVTAATGSESTSSGLYSFFSYICHQRPERSFHLLGHKLGVCSRCCGVYFGLILGVLVYPLIRNIEEVNPLPLFWLVLSMIPIGVDWSLTMFGIWENTFFTRFSTGLILGIACSIFIVPALAELAHIYQLRKSRVTVGT